MRRCKQLIKWDDLKPWEMGPASGCGTCSEQGDVFREERLEYGERIINVGAIVEQEDAIFSVCSET